MPDSIRVAWMQGSEFLRLVEARTARKTRLHQGIDDPLEPWSEVWAGLNDEFMDGQTLEGTEVGRMLIIIDRRISNYYRSKGARSIEQLGLSHFDFNDIEDVRSALDPPDQLAIQQEQFRLVAEKLSEMPTHRAEAVRSRFGLPGAPKWSELVQTSGTTRQNLANHAKRGLEELKRAFT